MRGRQFVETTMDYDSLESFGLKLNKIVTERPFRRVSGVVEISLNFAI